MRKRMTEGLGFEPLMVHTQFYFIIYYYILSYIYKIRIDSSMVRIRAFQARGPSSIPGRCIIYIFCYLYYYYYDRIYDEKAYDIYIWACGVIGYHSGL